MKLNRLTDLSKVEKDGKSYFHTTMKNIDLYGHEPYEDANNRFYFLIEIDGKLVRFYQYGEIPNAFSDEVITQAYIFKPDDEKYKNVELHIINDYE